MNKKFSFIFHKCWTWYPPGVRQKYDVVHRPRFLEMEAQLQNLSPCSQKLKEHRDGFGSNGRSVVEVPFVWKMKPLNLICFSTFTPRFYVQSFERWRIVTHFGIPCFIAQLFISCNKKFNFKLGHYHFCLWDELYQNVHEVYSYIVNVACF